MNAALGSLHGTTVPVPTEEKVREAQRSVDDPEVGTNIINLRPVHRIDISPELARVLSPSDLATTSMGGPD